MSQHIFPRSLIASLAVAFAIPACGLATDAAAVLQRLEGGNGDAVLGARWNLAGERLRAFTLLPHRATYVLPVSYNANPNERAFRDAGIDDGNLQRNEVVYQLSFKAVMAQRLVSATDGLWFGFTQKAWWQAYNLDESLPFRETNYEPEVIYGYPADFSVMGLRVRQLRLGLNHLSNGRGGGLSRSVNRVIAGVLFDDGRDAIELQAWWTLPDDSDIAGRDIVDYMGRAQLDWYRPVGESTVRVMLRNNLSLDDNRGSAMIGYSFPLRGWLRGYAEYRYGYADGLIDYDSISHRLSVGLMLIGWR